MSKRKVHRDAGTGEFVTEAEAKARPAETVTETVSGEVTSLRALLGAIHARLNQPDAKGGLRPEAVVTILDEIEAEIPELAPLRA